MGENFAFLVPVTLGLFGCAFLAAWRWGARSALPWGVGYLCATLGFILPVFPPGMSEGARSIVADALFATAFFLYGQALLVRIGRSWLFETRLTIAAMSVGLCAYARVGLQDPAIEFALSDGACALLLGIPAIAMIRSLRRPVDVMLLAASMLVVLETAIRGATSFLTARAGDFLSTEYAMLMQITTTIFGMIFALVALAAIVLDIFGRLRDDAFVDLLSGLLNRRGFEEAAALPRRADQGGSIVACDIDHFKRVNDLCGHAAGDRVIATLAAMIRAELPEGGIAARFGGEEFVAYLPEADTVEAARFANAVRLRFGNHPWLYEGIALPLSASFGLSAVQPGDFSLHDAIARADAGLYDAKEAGRDRVSVRLAVVPPFSVASAVRPAG